MEPANMLSGHSPPINTRAPTWAVGLLGGVLLWSLATDLHELWETSYDGSVMWWLLATRTVLDHVALALAGIYPYAAAAVIWCAVPLALATGQVGMTALSLPGVTVAVLALCRPKFVAAHSAVAIGWVIAHAVMGPADASWIILIILIPAIVIGLLVRFFLIRTAGERERLRVATETMSQVRDQERAALSRELHDAVASGLALISMETTSVEESTNPDELRGALTTVQRVSRDTSAELRLLVRTLREPASQATPSTSPLADDLADGSLAAVTHHLVGALTDRSYQTTTNLIGLDDIATADLLPTVLHTYLRIVQEAVTNIIKHAPPQANCQVWARAAGPTLRFTITNDLPAPGSSTPHTPTGVGLSGIQERAVLTSGFVFYGPQNGQWIVDAALPLRPTDVV
ncbi:MAG: histidine kinase [Propionicimonas sp.]